MCLGVDPVLRHEQAFSQQVAPEVSCGPIQGHLELKWAGVISCKLNQLKMILGLADKTRNPQDGQSGGYHKYLQDSSANPPLTLARERSHGELSGIQNE